MKRPSPIGAIAIPPAPTIKVRSKNKLLIMFGVPYPYKWERRGGYVLNIMQGGVLQCASCHKMNIIDSSLCGYNAGEFHNHFLCENCLSLPKDFTIFEVKIKLRRKSSLNPNGIRTRFVVSTVSKMAKWMREVVKVYPSSTVKHLRDNLYENAKTDIDKSKRLAYILNSLWDFLPAREV